MLQYSCSAGLAPLQSVCTIDTKNVTTLKHPQKYPYSCVELGGRAVEGTSEASSYSEQDTKADQNDKRALASAYRLTKCWRFATVLESLLENSTPHQLRWASSVQMSPSNPFAHGTLHRGSDQATGFV